MFYGRKEYIGRTKKQTYDNCQVMAFTAFLTQYFYEAFGVVKEFDADEVYKRSESRSGWTDKQVVAQVYENGISEEGRYCPEEYRLNVEYTVLDDYNDVVDVLERGGHVIAGVSGIDPKMPHAMYLLNVEYINGAVTYTFQNSHGGNGKKVITDRKHYVKKNNFREVRLVEPYQRITMQTNNTKFKNNWKDDKVKYIAPTLLNNASNVVGIREIAELFGLEVVWHGERPLENGKLDPTKFSIFSKPKGV